MPHFTSFKLVLVLFGSEMNYFKNPFKLKYNNKKENSIDHQ